MFTGIIEETGTVNSIIKRGSSVALGISCSFAQELAIGESVAVNGACLTVTSKTASEFTADVTPESFRRTTLGSLHALSSVNLERAMKADGRFGGHIVSGHIDGTGTIINTQKEENAVNIRLSVPVSIGRYIIEKGSVCIDGISLTVASVLTEADMTSFTAAVIPHTWRNTTLCAKHNGDKVNIECDLVGKYIEHFLAWDKRTSIDTDPQAEDSPQNGESQIRFLMENFVSFH